MNRPADLVEDVAEVLLPEDAIQAKVAELGARISADYAGRELTLVSVLKGSLPFMADLMRAISIPVQIDLMEVSSYGGTATESSGLVRILKDLSSSIDGRDVLIVEDIIDTGLTLNYLVRYLKGKNPASLRICTLLDKPARRLVEIPIDYRGFTIPDRFVIGYGLDYGERYRNLRFVGVLRPEVYTSVELLSIGARSGEAASSPGSPRSSSSSGASCRGSGSGAATASRRWRETPSRAQGSSSSWPAWRRSPSWPCRSPPATGRSPSTAGGPTRRSRRWRSSGWRFASSTSPPAGPASR
jgi:hypoxanthine phosphoribosyltransferase